MSNNLSKRNAVVTGAGSGIGQAIALCLAERGAAVVVSDINLDNARQTADEITRTGGKAIAVHCDAVVSADIENLAICCERDLGELHIWVNNVGGGPQSSDYDDSSDEMWNAYIAINLNSTYFGSRTAVNHMKAGGSIVNIASVCAKGAVPGMGAYGAAKAAVLHLTKTMAVENIKKGIRINAVCPGATLTQALRFFYEQQPGGLDAFENQIVGRFGEVDEIAKAVAFLAGEEASFINGESLVVDGGSELILPSRISML